MKATRVPSLLPKSLRRRPPQEGYRSKVILQGNPAVPHHGQDLDGHDDAKDAQDDQAKKIGSHKLRILAVRSQHIECHNPNRISNHEDANLCVCLCVCVYACKNLCVRVNVRMYVCVYVCVCLLWKKEENMQK